MLAELTAHGVQVEAEFVPRATRRGFTFIDENGERTITVIGDKLHPSTSHHLPWLELGRADGVYFTAGDVSALEAARRARMLVATSRELATLRRAGVEVGRTGGKRGGPRRAVPPRRPRAASQAGRLRPRARWRVDPSLAGPFRAASLPGPVSRRLRSGRLVRRWAHLRPGERARPRRGARPRLPLWGGRDDGPRPLRGPADLDVSPSPFRGVAKWGAVV